ncbi:hypothetical protein [Streptomyces zingiberis]|uniref:Uncharacterized protein n=1 Tax=Streptomyces zingiberis TaxID=2053010 RepID=A0ABX1BZI1_9ACTN|nr:hypothetical protein [Streptomyces zingiberis]NJQ01728.1 hypothetical protein [Streptomyces zingiberis]
MNDEKWRGRLTVRRGRRALLAENMETYPEAVGLEFILVRVAAEIAGVWGVEEIQVDFPAIGPSVIARCQKGELRRRGRSLRTIGEIEEWGNRPLRHVAHREDRPCTAPGRWGTPADRTDERAGQMAGACLAAAMAGPVTGTFTEVLRVTGRILAGHWEPVCESTALSPER